MHLTVVVNGESCVVEVTRPCSLADVRLDALLTTRNTGRPAEDFQLRLATGESVEDDQLAQELEDGAVIYASLRVGWGGSHMNYRRKNFPGNRPQCGARSTKEERIRTLPKYKLALRRTERRKAKRADREPNRPVRCGSVTQKKWAWLDVVTSIDDPQLGVTALVDVNRNYTHIACSPECQHFVSAYRGARSRPSSRYVQRAYLKYCAVVDVETTMYDRTLSLTACGDFVRCASLTHRMPNCPDCRRALRASGLDLDVSTL